MTYNVFSGTLNPTHFTSLRPISVVAKWLDGSRCHFCMEVGLGPGDFVSDGDPAPLPKRGGTPSQIFSPCLLWPYGCIGQDGTWDGGRPQPRRLCVRWGSSPLPKKGVEPPLQFLVHFYCGQTALCIKMPLGVEVSLSPLSPGDFVLDGDPAPHQKEGGAPQFLARGYCDQTADGSRWHLVWRYASAQATLC